MRRRLIYLFLLLRSQQSVVKFTDALQGGLEFLVVAQPLLDHGLLFGAEADLPGASTRITDGQYPDGVALSVGTDRTTGAMADVAVEQRAPEDLGGGWQSCGELGTLTGDCRLLHHY